MQATPFSPKQALLAEVRVLEGTGLDRKTLRIEVRELIDEACAADPRIKRYVDGLSKYALSGLHTDMLVAALKVA